MSYGNFNKIPKFLKKLYREVSDPENTSINWSENGENIIISNKKGFLEYTLPTLSRTKEYSAFVRQLNMYGFVKIKNERSDETEEYSHIYFKRNQPNLIGFIKRISKTSLSDRQLNLINLENTLNFLTNSNYRLSKEVEILKERVAKQDKTVEGLIDILGRVFRTGLENIDIESPYKNHNLDSLCKYNPPIEIKKENENKEAFKGFLTNSKNSDNKNNDLPDMNSIFF